MLTINKKKGKTVTLIILILLTVPFFINYIILQTHSLTGVNIPQWSKQENKQITDKEILQSGFLGYFFGNPNVGNKPKNSDFVTNSNINNDRLRANDSSPLAPVEQPKVDLEEQPVRVFKTQLVVRNQPEEAVASTSLALKTSYDISYNNKKTTIFVTKNDPKLINNNDLAINFEMAKRIGIEVDKTSTFEIEVKQRK